MWINLGENECIRNSDKETYEKAVAGREHAMNFRDMCLDGK
jgi:hypothetical protein